MIKNNEEALKWFSEQNNSFKAIQVQNYEGAIKLISDYSEAISFMSSNVKSSLINQFKIVLGDAYNDGNGLSEAMILFASAKSNEIETAFRNVSRKMGFLKEYRDTTYTKFTLCGDYEQFHLTVSQVQTLANNGIQVESCFNKEDNEEADDEIYPVVFRGSKKSYLHLLMRIAQQELDFTYIIADIPSWDISLGYGLYNN